MRAIKSNMIDQIGTPLSGRQILRCPECGDEFSGNAGDYWDLPDDHVFTCEHCKLVMELVVKHTTVTFTD